MAEETMTAVPDVGGAVPSAPETPTTAPETPTAAVEATPVVETAPELVREPGEDELAFIKRGAAAKDEWTKKQAKPEVTTEPPKPEPPKPEEKKEEPKEETKDEDDVETEPFSLEDKAPLPPRELAAKLKADPELAAKLEAAGIKDEVFANARLAAKSVAFLETFPGGVDEAKYARQQAEHFGAFDDIVTSIKTDGIKAVDAFMGKMLEMDYVVDDNGQPIVDPQTGFPLQQGNIQALVTELGNLTWQQRLGSLEKEASEQAKANPEDEEAQNVLAAIEVLKARSKGSAPEELTPAQKAKAAELQSREEALARDQEQREQADYQAREERIGTESDSAINSEIESVLSKTDLPKGQWALVLDKVRNQAAERLAKDTLFTSRRDWIMRAKYSPSVEKQRIAHSVTSTRNAVLGRNGILAKELKELGIKIVGQQQARREQIDTQVKNSRSEQKGATTLAAAPSPLSNAELRVKAVESIRTSGGDPNDEGELLRTMTRIRATGR